MDFMNSYMIFFGEALKVVLKPSDQNCRLQKIIVYLHSQAIKNSRMFYSETLIAELINHAPSIYERGRNFYY